MDFKSYFSDQPTVDISVAKIKGRRLTRSILKQIQPTKSFMPTFDLDGVKIIGLVQDSERCVVLIRDGQLFKSNIEEFLKLINLETTVQNVGNYIEFSTDLGGDSDIDWHGSYTQLDEVDQEKFNFLREKAQRMFTILKSHQIYL